MRKLYLFFAFVFTLNFYCQNPPVLEGTYFPVKNTSIKQVWDVTSTTMAVPQIGQNMTWDYSFANNQFLNVTDTFNFAFFDPAATPYAQYFPSATHATYVRTPFNSPSDSLYYYWVVNRDGMYNLGGFNIKNDIDSLILHDQMDFVAPSLIKYNDSIISTVKTTLFVKNLQGYKAKVRQIKNKKFKYVAYGTLKIPNGNYSDVGMIRETSTTVDSIYIDLFNNGNYSYFTQQSSANISYQFLRNNTFGSNFLMYLNVDSTNTTVEYGWYTLPVDFGTISGNVYTNISETTPVTNGEMYLYRENSNFSKNDVLARTQLQANGAFQFDSIPYGEYRIAVRPDLTSYPNSKITYYGDTTNWLDASSIITTTTTSLGHKIHLQYHPTPVGSSSITGVIAEDWNFNKGNSSAVASIPVPGVGVVIKKHPGNTTARVLVTDSTGAYDLGDLDDGSYEIFVDIPGLHMTGTYNFTVSNGSLVNSLHFTVGKDSIHPFNSAAISVKELTDAVNKIRIKAYPNPFSQKTNIEIENEKSQNIKLELFDINGKRIKTIASGNFSKGKHQIELSAKDFENNKGVFFIKETLENGNSKTIRIINQ